MQIVQRSATQRYRVQLHPAGPYFGPFATDRNALALQTARTRPAAALGRRAERFEQAVESPGAGRQQRLAHIAVDPVVILLLGGQPLRLESMQACAAGLKCPIPDRLDHRQERRRIILPRPPDDRSRAPGLLCRAPAAQSADGGLAE